MKVHTRGPPTRCLHDLSACFHAHLIASLLGLITVHQLGGLAFTHGVVGVLCPAS
ncbi:hypothetical protein BU23DRAFT_62242 [Bimuria novae-zelandiae CBS 107.79]|uniref:Uncharacterized protein n=1 Tax=Bimuria novae-zelandiae CBS 107.79 TaxID=1447943 RepID=A0A6A5UII0_9PLEO|nr:hypothetical protein BU23DRAFT_62242 [Bimuria novae-zelandiae CBS 107.79]